MKRNILKAFAVLIVLGVITAGVYMQRVQSAAALDEVESFKEVAVRQGDIKISFLADGKASIPVLKLDFPINGQLKEVAFDTGSNIKKGDVIARLEDSDYNNKLDSARIAYNQAVVKLEKTKQQYASELITEKSKLDNLKYQKDNIALSYLPMEQIPDVYSKQELESKKAAYGNAQAAYSSALQAYNLLSKGSRDIEFDEINIQQAQVAINTAADNLDDTVLRSPVDGAVLSIANRPGEMLSSSNDAAAFAVVSDIGGLSVTALVSELDVAGIKKDQKVDLAFEAFSEQPFVGRVLSIEPLAVTDASGIVSYTVNIGIENAADKIRDGMTCTVAFILKEKLGVVVIPNAAVTIVDGKQLVETKEKSGEIVTKAIKTGLTDGINVEVIDGLGPGEIVIVRTKK